MGKFSNTFEMKLADLTADVEAKIGVLFMKNPLLEKVTFKKPTAMLLDFKARLSDDNGRKYIELYDVARDAADDMRRAFTIKQMIIFLEEIEEVLEENETLA